MIVRGTQLVNAMKNMDIGDIRPREVIDTIASHVDSFGLKRLTHIVLTKHRPCHINECSILPLNKVI